MNIGSTIIAAILAAGIVVVGLSISNKYYYGCSELFKVCVAGEKPIK